MTHKHRSRHSKAECTKPNSEPCYQCDLRDHCQQNGVACNIFTRWLKSGKIITGERKFQGRAF